MFAAILSSAKLKSTADVISLFCVSIFAVFLLTPLPIAAQANNDSLPTAPFDRLLFRLDHAPIDLDKLNASAEHGSAMQQAGVTYEAAIAPITPVLEKMGHSSTLHFLGRMPLLGKPVTTIQSSLGLAIGLSNGFTKLVDMDRRDLQPLRNAIQASATLRHSRQPRDLPQTARSLNAAILPLTLYEATCEKQNQALQSLITALDNIQQRRATQKSQQIYQVGSLAKAINKLKLVSQGLTTRTQEIRMLRLYTEDCAMDANAAMKGTHNDQ